MIVIGATNLPNELENNNGNEISVNGREDEIWDVNGDSNDGYNMESEPESVTSSKVSRTEGKKVAKKWKVEVSGQGAKHVNQCVMMGTEIYVAKSVAKILTQKLENKQSSSNSMDADDIFGKMIASELKQFPEHLKFQVKHELSSVIYKHRMQNMSPHMNHPQEFVQSQFPSSNPTQHFQPSNFSSPTQQVSSTAQHYSASRSWMNNYKSDTW